MSETVEGPGATRVTWLRFAVVVAGTFAVVLGVAVMYRPVNLHWGVERRWTLIHDATSVWVGLVLMVTGVVGLFWALPARARGLVVGGLLAVYGVGTPFVGFLFGDFQSWVWPSIDLALLALSWVAAAAVGGRMIGRWAATPPRGAGCVFGLVAWAALTGVLVLVSIATSADEVPFYNRLEVEHDLGFVDEIRFGATWGSPGDTPLRDVNLLPASTALSSTESHVAAGSGDGSPASSAPVSDGSPCTAFVAVTQERQPETYWESPREAPLWMSTNPNQPTTYGAVAIEPGASLRLSSAEGSYPEGSPASRVFSVGAVLTITLCTLDGVGTVNSPATAAVPPETPLGITTADASGRFDVVVTVPAATPRPDYARYPDARQRVLVSGAALDGLPLYSSEILAVIHGLASGQVDTPIGPVDIPKVQTDDRLGQPVVGDISQGMDEGLSSHERGPCAAIIPLYVAVPADKLEVVRGGEDEVLAVRTENDAAEYDVRLAEGLAVRVRGFDQPTLAVGDKVDVRYTGPPSDYGQPTPSSVQSVGEQWESTCFVGTDVLEGMYGSLIFVLRLLAGGAFLLGMFLGLRLTRKRAGETARPAVM